MKFGREAFEGQMEAQRKRAREARGNTVGLGWAGDDVSLKELPATVLTGDARLAGQVPGAGPCGRRGAEPPFPGPGGAGAGRCRTQTPFVRGKRRADNWETGTLELRPRAVPQWWLCARQQTANSCTRSKWKRAGWTWRPQWMRRMDQALAGRPIMRAHSAARTCCERRWALCWATMWSRRAARVEPDRLRFDFTHFSAVTPESRQ